MAETATRSMYAAGNIKPYRFVTLSSTAYKVTQSTDGVSSAGQIPFGVSQERVWQPPITTPSGGTLDDGYCGTTTSPPIEVYINGAECFLCAGAAVSVGALLKADSDGRGITASVAGDNYGAQALEAATAANQLIRVRVLEQGIVPA